VGGAAALARVAGLSEAGIGLSVVAVGDSLSELVRSRSAVQRGPFDIAVGNVVGSNVFDRLLALAVTATLAPVSVPTGGRLERASCSRCRRSCSRSPRRPASASCAGRGRRPS